MELRHLRYFIAVAEEGSLTVAAEQRLHTAQPSLSRQIRDLEYEVGAQLLVRSARGVELTQSGRAFLDHARLALVQVEAAVEAARRVAKPAKPTFALGFLTGQEMDWLPEAMRILRDELPNIEVSVSSQYSPNLAQGLLRGKLDLAFMRPEAQMPDLVYRVVVKEPLIVAMPSDHRLASQDTIALQDIAGETFIGMSNTAPALRVVIEEYLERMGLDLIAKMGNRIVVSGRKENAGEALVTELRALGAEAEFVRADVRNEDDVRGLVDRTVERFGRLDAAVNNAGTLRGPSGARDEFLLAATTQNLRKLAKLIPVPAPIFAT